MRATIKFLDPNKTRCVATGKCVMSGEEYTTAEFPVTALEAYNNGAYIQDAFPMLDAGDREFIISLISPRMWDKIFAGEEE